MPSSEYRMLATGAGPLSDVISSRTPEGSPNRCPICQAMICVEPSQPPGDAPCPHCGNLLWFSKPAGSSGPMLIYDYQKVIAPIEERVSESLGISREEMHTHFIEDVGAASLDIVQLVMELEEEFDLTIPPDIAGNFRTLGEAIDWIMRERERRKESGD